MKKISKMVAAFAAVLLMTVSCGKQGPQGPVGPQGPAGHDGNANVVSSSLWVESNDWVLEENEAGATYWRVDIDYPAITADIVDYGAVLVYMNDMAQGTTWRQLPYTFYYSIIEDGTEYFYSSSLEVSSYLNCVSIFWTESDFYEGYQPDRHQFKIVVIAASTYAAHPEVDYSNYEAVKEAFNLTDTDVAAVD